MVDANVELMSTVALEAFYRPGPPSGPRLDAALACGAYLPAVEFLIEGQAEAWAALCRALPAVGWRPAVRWIDTEVDVIWVPGDATREQVDAAKGVREVHPADPLDTSGRFVCYLSYLDPDDEGDRDIDGEHAADVADVLAWIARTDGPSGE